jgi:L-erythro-3,5-diaminohexanoate dehydrogenase
VFHQIEKLTDGQLADLTINVVNVENTEMTSILSTKDQGIVYFFSMATSFTKAALGAEGVSKDVEMIIGNGYTKNHAKITLDIMRESKALHDLFMKRYQ